MKPAFFLAALGLLGVVGCASSDAETGQDVSNIERGGTERPRPAPEAAATPFNGPYVRAAEEARDGVLTITKASRTSIDFDITAHTIVTAEDGDPGMVGTHEGGVAGTATFDGKAFVYKAENDCELSFSFVPNGKALPKFSVTQKDDGICQPNPLIAVDGDYRFTPERTAK